MRTGRAGKEPAVQFQAIARPERNVFVGMFRRELKRGRRRVNLPMFEPPNHADPAYYFCRLNSSFVRVFAFGLRISMSWSWYSPLTFLKLPTSKDLSLLFPASYASAMRIPSVSTLTHESTRA